MWYFDAVFRNSWTQDYFFGCMNNNTSPGEYDFPSEEWEAEREKILAALKSGVLKNSAYIDSGEKWERVVCQPALYINNDGNLFVSAYAPDSASISSERIFVAAVGKDEIEMKRKNGRKYNLFCPQEPREVLGETAAIMAVRDLLDLDFAADYIFEGVKLIDEFPESFNEPAHFALVVKVVSQDEDHGLSTVVGRYAVGAFDDNIWTEDVVKHGWKLIEVGTNPLEVTVAPNSLAVAFKDPTPYMMWRANYMTVYSMEGANAMNRAPILIEALYDDTIITVENKKMAINASEYVLINCYIGDDEKETVIKISANESEGEYILRSNDYFLAGTDFIMPKN